MAAAGQQSARRQQAILVMTILLIPYIMFPLQSRFSSLEGGGGNNKHQYNHDTVLYTYARDDRSGAAIQDMLFAHAFAFSKNVTYGGACADEPSPKKSSLTPAQILEHHKDQQNVIQMLGLQDALPFACPKDAAERGGGIIMNRKDYYQQDTKIWSREWVKHIQSLVTYPTITPPRRTAALQVAVHIRRGDVTPCRNANRYLPNSYYLNILDAYLPPKNNDDETYYEVSIYSNADLFEGWEPFVKRNYSLNLDTDALDVWKAFMTADIFIMSKSSMSLVPAMLNRKNDGSSSTIFYTPFWHQPLDDWIVVPSNLLEAIEPEMERLRRQCPS
jgi:hypothetical protein